MRNVLVHCEWRIRSFLPLYKRILRIKSYIFLQCSVYSKGVPLLDVRGSSGVQTFAYIVPFGEISDFLDHESECEINGFPPHPENKQQFAIKINFIKIVRKRPTYIFIWINLWKIYMISILKNVIKPVPSNIWEYKSYKIYK